MSAILTTTIITAFLDIRKFCELFSFGIEKVNYTHIYFPGQKYNQ